LIEGVTSYGQQRTLNAIRQKFKCSTPPPVTDPYYVIGE